MIPNKNFKILTSFNEVANKYDAFIIDIWGVLWDGLEPIITLLSLLKNLWL